MEYQKINKFRFRRKLGQKNWAGRNDDAGGTYNFNSQIKFKATMLNPSLCDYSDAHILFKGTVSAANTAAPDAHANNVNIKVIFKHRAPFIECIEINNAQVDNAKDSDAVMPMHKLIEYCDNYWKTSGKLWQYFIDESAANKCGTTKFDTNNSTTDLFKLKEKKQESR